MTSVSSVLRGLCLCLLVVGQSAALAYKIKIDITMPTGSAGEIPTDTQPTGTKLTPCKAGLIDAIDIKVTYDAKAASTDTATAGTLSDRDVYLIFQNPDNDPRFLMVRKPSIALNGKVFVGFRRMTDMDTMDNRHANTFIPREVNISGTGTEPVLGGTLPVEGVITGAWQMTGIIGDRASPNFSLGDPATWDAWDVTTVMFGGPWTTSVNSNCQ